MRIPLAIFAYIAAGAAVFFVLRFAALRTVFLAAFFAGFLAAFFADFFVAMMNLLMRVGLQDG